MGIEPGTTLGCSSVTCLTAPDTYVIKLFDRSVDLAQFSENTPLYPICRAWMRNSPTVRERERSPGSPLPPLPEDGEVGGVSGGQREQWVALHLEIHGGVSLSMRLSVA